MHYDITRFDVANLVEAILNRDVHVSHTIMFGRGRFNVGVLVDPLPEFRFDPTDAERLKEFRNLIWFVNPRHCTHWKNNYSIAIIGLR